MKAQSMEFSSYPYSSFDTEGNDRSGLWQYSDATFSHDGFSTSIVYHPSDFPFPSIRYPTEIDDQLDSQFSFGCVHGGGSMLSSLDVSLESCIGMLIV